jgi:hypothetical protein
MVQLSTSGKAASQKFQTETLPDVSGFRSPRLYSPRHRDTALHKSYRWKEGRKYLTKDRRLAPPLSLLFSLWFYRGYFP